MGVVVPIEGKTMNVIRICALALRYGAAGTPSMVTAWANLRIAYSAQPQALGTSVLEPEDRHGWKVRFSRPAEVPSTLSRPTQLETSMPEYVMFLAHRGGMRALDVLDLIGPPPANGVLTLERARDIMNTLIVLGYTASDLPTDGEVTAAWRAASKVVAESHRQEMMETLRIVEDEMVENRKIWEKAPWWRK